MIDSKFVSQYSAPDDLLQGKIILVSGAGDGIGRVAALNFAKFGATVILLGRTMNKLEAVYDEIEALKAPQPAIFPLNLESATEQDYQALHDAIEKEFEHLDGILHNAAELGRRTPIASHNLTDWQKVMQVNVTAPFLLTKSLLPLLEKSNSASVVFITSSVADRGKAYWGAYSVSKAATENLMEVLADEFDGVSKIRANAINPGATRTRMRATAYPAEDPASVSAPEEIMNSYLFLMGRDSESISGQLFHAQPK